MASKNIKPDPYNQGWKDSGQALVNTDGSIVKTPIALVESQGYAYDAWLRMAQIYDAGALFWHAARSYRLSCPVPRRQRAASLGSGIVFRHAPDYRRLSLDAPAGKPYIDPALLEWLPELTIRDLQVGQNVFDLRFWRDEDATRFETLKGDPAAVVQKSYAMAIARWL